MGIVEEAINKLTVEKINVEVELLPISLGTYEQQINLMISGNEKLDLFTLLGSSFASTLNQKKIVPIDADLMNEDYVQEILMSWAKLICLPLMCLVRYMEFLY